MSLSFYIHFSHLLCYTATENSVKMLVWLKMNGNYQSITLKWASCLLFYHEVLVLKLQIMPFCWIIWSTRPPKLFFSTGHVFWVFTLLLFFAKCYICVICVSPCIVTLTFSVLHMKVKVPDKDSHCVPATFLYWQLSSNFSWTTAQAALSDLLFVWMDWAV